MKKKLPINIILIIFIISIFTTTINANYNIVIKNIDKINIEKIIKNINENNILPSSFDWRNVNGIDYTTPIRNQAPYPSCESFALVAAVETMVQIKVGFSFNCDLSEAHLYFWSGGNLDWGSYPENDTDFLKNYGVPDEACWPYPKEKIQYPLNTTSPDWQNRTVKITNWSYLPNDPQKIKESIVNNGPVPSYFTVYDDFLKHKNGIYYHRWGDSRGAHYVAIVGYNDDPGYWICKNSWGTKYQENGWFKIGYGECDIGRKAFLLKGVYGQFPILYVDDDNTAGPWDGSINYPYKNIQDAINKAYNGYTIYVKNGFYYENLIINKTINLKGEDKNNTIINGNYNGEVITVKSPKVKIDNFTITNSGNSILNAGIKTLFLDSNITITDNIIKNNNVGIFLNYAYEQSSNIVKGNIIYDNERGIYSHWSNNNQLENNIIRNNNGSGIMFIHSQNANIINNQIIDNIDYGLYILGDSNNNLIKENNIEKNGLGIYFESSHKISIIKNNLINNEKQAYFDNSLMNKWRRNYWNDWERIIPKTIKGVIGVKNIPWLNFDWLPSKQLIQ